MAPKEKSYCAYCTKLISQLASHTRRLHPHQGKPLKLVMDREQKCPHCQLPLSYSKRGAFLSHVRSCYLNPGRIFRPGGPYRCPHCVDRKFAQSYNLLKHLRLKHSSQPAAPSTSAAAGDGEEDSKNLAEKIYELIDGNLDPSLLIDFERTEKESVQRLKLDGIRTHFRFTKLCRELATYGFFLDSIAAVFKYLLNVDEIRDNYLVGISLESPSELEYPIPMPLMLGKNFKMENFLNQIENTIQSHSDLGLNSDVVLNIVALPNPNNSDPAVGARLNPRKFLNLIDFLRRKRGLFDPEDLKQPNANICLPLCIAVAIVMKSAVHLKSIKKENRTNPGMLPRKISQIIEMIYARLGLQFNTKITPSIEVFEQIQMLLLPLHHRLLVYKLFDDKIANAALFFSGEHSLASHTISLLIYDTHCFLITSELLFFGKPKKHYCSRCHMSHSSETLCDIRCRFCTSQVCANSYPYASTLRELECKDCLQVFKNKICFETHQKLNVCQMIAKCSVCRKTMWRDRLAGHACGLHKCRNCSDYVDANHKCFIQNVVSKKSNRVQVFIFFDIESMALPDGSHKPNVVVLYRCCDLCMDQLDNMEALCCMRGNRKHVFIGKDCLKESIKFMFFHPDNTNAIAIAHYGSGYDFIFMLKTLLEMDHRPTKIYCRNLRILQFTAGLNVTLKDSYLWFGCKLRKLSDLWTIPVRKCFFNHAWNMDTKLDYTGPWPSMEEFGIGVENEDYHDFVEWYGRCSKERPVYRMLEELILYCEVSSFDWLFVRLLLSLFHVDVDLLYRACQKFRSLVLSQENVDPFKVSMSIASLTAYVYRLNYMPPQSIPLVLDKNVAAIGLRQQSKVAMKYLSWLAHSEYPNLKYAGNGPEHLIFNYRVGSSTLSHMQAVLTELNAQVDGFDSETNTAIEVFGDMIHACPKHTQPEGIHPLKPHLTNCDVYDQSMVKIFDLRKANYTVRLVWECEIEEEVKQNLSMKQWFNEREKWSDLEDPISARDALHGGRVEAFILLLELSDEMREAGWRVNYLDVVSLYPYVQSDPQFYYPTDHPTIINGCELRNEGKYPTFDELDTYFDLISAVCYGPDSLLIPVLPVKHPKSGRLIFPLCGPCAFVEQEDECGHYGEERSFKGCWTSPELLRAVQLGFGWRQFFLKFIYSFRLYSC